MGKTLKRAGIIAAGKGERFLNSGITTPKPLIRVGNEPLIVRLVNALRNSGIEEIAVIINSSGREVRQELMRRFPN